MIAPSGRKDARIFVCGEAPGRQELEEGIPFVGPTGRILWACFKEAGIDRKDCYVTNVIQSAPLGTGGSPTPSQIREEWERLDLEMKTSAAEVVVLVGGHALKRVTGLSNITNLRGYCLTPADLPPMLVSKNVQVGVYKTSKAGYFKRGDAKFVKKKVPVQPTLPPHVKWVIAVLHPANIMRMQFKTLPALKADLLRVGRLLRGEAEVLSVDNITWGEPNGHKLVAVDIETPMPPNDWVVERIGFASGAGAASGTDISRLRSRFNELKSDPEVTLILHNSSFDLPRLDAIDFEAKLFDTMHAAQLLNPDLPKGLERAATMHLDLRPWKHLFQDRPAVYNAMDARVTYALAMKQAAILEATGQRPVFETMMRAMPTLMKLTLKGIRVDESRLVTWRAELERKLADAHARWKRPDVAPTSYRKLVTYLYGDLGLPTQYSKDGGVTTDDAAIYHLLTLDIPSEGKAALEALRDIRDAGRNLSTYAAVAAGADGRVHPRYVTADKDEAGATFTQKGQGAGTGRIQARDPNIMNQPVEARRLYVPSEDTWCFGYIDWSSAEARVEAALSGDTNLAEAINGDLHETIRSALGIDRTRAKNIFYGTGRGAGPRTLARTMADAGFPTSIAECEEMQNRLFRLFPAWAGWRNNLIDLGRRQGFITNPMGRRRYFYTRNAGSAMIGFIPQSTVADMLWDIIPRVPGLVTTIHDAVLVEAPAANIREVVQTTQAIMEKPWPEIGLDKVPTDAKIGLPGESWGDMELRYASN